MWRFHENYFTHCANPGGFTVPKKDRAASIIGLAAIVSLIPAARTEGGTLQGEGATSQQCAMDLLATKFGEAGSTLSHNAFGSGSGQTQPIVGTATFAGSDFPLKEKGGKDQVAEAKGRCDGNGVWHLPMVISLVAATYNLEDTDITLTPALVAKIFDGKITEWNNPKIAEVNKDAKLPEKNIRVVCHSEESGITDSSIKFLSAAAPDQWKHEASKSFPATTGQGANGSTGTVDEVFNIDGAITYVEASFAEGRNLDIAKTDFGHSPIGLNNDTVGKALDFAMFKTGGHNMIADTDALLAMDENGTYPLTPTTYEIVCSAGYGEETRDLIKSLLGVVLEENQGPELEELGHIPVQDELKNKLSTAVDAIK